ncbi:MAG: DUF4292 domain-containing protein [Muribaculaceae bacterium]|nr:DUF4292 domain-containing protein [Muribaculaceae bacterium]
MKKIMALLMLVLFCSVSMQAQNTYEPVIDNIVRSYMPWQSVTFSGKVKTEKLPVSPNVKIFMERDSLIQISVRVPLLGEVGRIDINTRQITAVNKLKRIYAQEPTQKLLEIYPGIFGDIQSLLLARVVVLGQGELRPEYAGIIEVEDDREGGWMLLPSTEDALLNYSYGYLIGSGGRMRALIANLPGKFSLELEYSYLNGGMQIAVDADVKGKHTIADIDFNSVKWGGTAFQPLKLVNYRKVGIKEFISSLK